LAFIWPDMHIDHISIHFLKGSDEVSIENIVSKYFKNLYQKFIWFLQSVQLVYYSGFVHFPIWFGLHSDFKHQMKHPKKNL